jgi:hypothetical protein
MVAPQNRIWNFLVLAIKLDNHFAERLINNNITYAAAFVLWHEQLSI